MASFTKEVNPRLAKRPLIFNGRLANRGLTFLVKEATAGVYLSPRHCNHHDDTGQSTYIRRAHSHGVSSAVSRRHKRVILGFSQWPMLRLRGIHRRPVNWLGWIYCLVIAGPHDSHYLSISKNITFTTICLKSLMIYATEMRLCKFWWEKQNDRWVRRT